MRFQCPQCKGIVSVDNIDAGREVECGHCRKRVTVPTSRTAPGAVLADFVLQSELGRGGMGVVYLSHQISLDRPAALKVLADIYAKNTEFVVGFIKEARSAAKLNHPNIVQAYAVGEDEGMYYFAMEYVEGKTMKQVLDKEKIIPVDKAVLIIEQIADALDYAWKEARLIHRDIKPDNIMLTTSGRAKLADLGLAKRADDKDDMGSEDEVMGTPQYISPEHLTGAPMDVRSDLYSLGATFFHFVTGRFPFVGENAVDIAKKHLNEPLVSPMKINPKVPPDVAAIIEKMMAKNPEDRYQDASRLVDDLRTLRKKKRTIQLNLSKIGSATQTQTGPIFFSSTATNTSLGAPVILNTVPVVGTNTAPTGSLMPPLTQPVPGQTATQTGLNSMIEKRETSSKRKFVALIAGGVILLGGIGAAVYAVIASDSLRSRLTALFQGAEKASPPEKKISEQSTIVKPVPVAPEPEPEPEPENTPYTVRAREVLKFAEDNPFKAGEIIERCEDLLLQTPSPKYRVERVCLARVLESYAFAEEQLLISKRTDRHDAFVRERIERERREELRRKEAAEREREARLKREEEERLAAEKRRAEEEKRKAYRREIDGLKWRLNQAWNGIRVKIYQDCSENRYDEAKKKLDALIASPSTVQGRPREVTDIAWRNAGWAKNAKKLVETAEKFAKLIQDSGPAAIKGTQVVYNRNFGTVQYSADGMIHAKVGGEDVSFKLAELDPDEREAFLRRVARTSLNDNEVLLYYMLLNGHIRSALLSAVMLTDRKQKDEFSAFAREILNDQYRKANQNQKRGMERVFGNPPEFRKSTVLK